MMRPRLVVVDASAAATFVFNEPDYVAAAALFSAAHRRQVQLVAPEFWSIECGNACWKRVRRRVLTKVEAAQAFPLFSKLPVKRIDSAELSRAALDMALWCDITTYDALYVVTTDFVGGELITADRPLLDALRSAKWQGRALHISEWTNE